jgi:hypothetical protein
MKRRLFLIFFSLSIVANSVCAEESWAYQSKVQFRILAGANIPITNFLQGTYVDNLFDYADKSAYRQIISATIFFHKHFGVEFNHQPSGSPKIRKRENNFFEAVRSKYGNDYYINIMYQDMYNSHGDFLWQAYMPRTFLGLVYRFETEKFYVYPKVSIGMQTIYSDTSRFELKKKNSNHVYELFYSSGGRHRSFILAPSVSLGYKLHKNIFLNADIMYSRFKPNIVFQKRFTNLYTQESTVEFFEYKRNVSTLSLGLGLIFAF